MDIEKLKAEFEQSECFKRLEHVAQYTFFEFGAYIKELMFQLTLKRSVAN